MAFRRFKRLVQGLTRTREGISQALRSASGTQAVDEALLDDLEAGLLAADLGPALTSEVMTEVRSRAGRGGLGREHLQGVVREAIKAKVGNGGSAATVREAKPRVVFVVGVNGGGKTTTVGKLAARELAAGRKVVVAAADTFRAAAIEQLERWAERAGAEMVRHREGADPAAVVFDALKAARSREVDTVLVDTAGRLHTKANLMAELEKLARVASREVDGAPHEVLLVVDATTGQNGLAQAREFTRAAPVSGVVLAKLDGTAKGGVALAIRRQLGVPVHYVGVGEGMDDLLDFDLDAFLDGLLGEEAA